MQTGNGDHIFMVQDMNKWNPWRHLHHTRNSMDQRVPIFRWCWLNTWWSGYPQEVIPFFNMSCCVMICPVVPARSILKINLFIQMEDRGLRIGEANRRWWWWGWLKNIHCWSSVPGHILGRPYFLTGTRHTCFIWSHTRLGLEAIALHGSNDSFPFFSYSPFHCHGYSIE